MKFTEEEAYKELVAKMTNNGKAPLQASERTIKAMLKRYYKKFADEETELTDFVNDNVDDFKEFDGQARKDNADFVKEYKKNNPIKDKIIDEPKPKDIDNEPNTELEKLMAEMAEIKQELLSTKREKTISQKKTELISKMKELGVKNDDWATTMVNKFSVNETTDIDIEANSFLELYNRFQADKRTFKTPDESSHTDTTLAEFENIKKLREERLKEQSKI